MAATSVSILFLSPYRFEKNSGMVIELLISEYKRILFATMRQFKYVPTANPIAVHIGSATPLRYASPGKPISSHDDMSEASALIAVTNGPSFRPPR